MMTRAEAGRLGSLAALKVNALLKQQRRDEYHKNPTLCKECKGIIPYLDRNINIFCSSSCFAKDNNRKRILKQRNCIVCNKIITSKMTKSRKYCSLKCSGEQRWRITKSAIELGLRKSNNILRKYLIEKFGYRCMICKLTEWSGKPIPIELDHIDGNSENNKLENLRLICLNCHGQTPTYKGKNVGKGRYYRKIRYREGKSY